MHLHVFIIHASLLHAVLCINLVAITTKQSRFSEDDVLITEKQCLKARYV